jgi:ABC-type dipeptide/oligopeptide/nickel transport system permease subunit
MSGTRTAPGTQTPFRRALRSFLEQRTARVGLTLLTVLVVAALGADVFASYGPIDVLIDKEPGAVRLAGPCINLFGCEGPEHIFGLDNNVRDVFSRVLHGARLSLQVGFLTVGFAIVLGSLIGAIAGFVGGWVDNLFMRIMDVLLAFPSLLLAIAIVTVIGPGLINTQLAIGVVAIPIYARVMRASVLSLRDREFVAASRALGASETSILFRKVLPNALTPIIVQGTLGIGGAILDVAALSFLGLGAQPPTAEWGSMIGSDRNLLFSSPHVVIFPGIAITMTVLAFNLIGDGLRDALDPRLQR